MVNTRGKKRTASTVSGEEGTSNPMGESNADDQFEDNDEISVHAADDKGPQEFPGQQEREKVAEVSSNDVNISAADMSNENKVESDDNISEDDEMDNQEDLMWDDEDDTSDEDNEDNVGGWDGASEDSVKEEDGNKVSADEALEEDDYNEDEVDGEKAAIVAEGNERELKAKEDKRKAEENANQREAKAKEDKIKAIDDDDDDDDEEEEEEEKKEEDQRKTKVEEKVEREAKVKEDERGAKVKEGGKELNDNRNDKQTADLKNDKDSRERSKKKKVRQGMPQKVDPKEKPESSHKRKRKKRVDSMGMIFMCSSMTKNDCYQYGVLGLPESKKDIVEKIYTGMRLFLYDVDLKLLYGIYKAAGPGGYNIEPRAFKSHFPAQVRFSVLDDCLPLPEEKFKKVIKENYFTKTKFDCQLKADQVKKLCKLFVISNKGHLPKKSGGPLRPEKKLHPSLQVRSKRRVRLSEDQHSRLRDGSRYREPHSQKRMRKAIARSPLRSQPLPRAPLAYAYERTTCDVDAYRRDPYPYRDTREPPTPGVILRDTYVDGRDTYLDRRDSYYRDGWDPYIERHNPYREAYVDRRAPPSYLERRDHYGEGQDLGIHRSFREGRDLYLEHRDPSRNTAYVEPSYGGGHRRVPLVSDRRDGYNLEHGFVHRPLSLESRYRLAIGGRDSIISTGQPLVYDDPIYSGEYPSRAGMDHL